MAKIAVLVSLLFMSNAAYAQDQQNGWKQGFGDGWKDAFGDGWKHGFGVHSVRDPGERQGVLQQSDATGLLIEYVVRRDLDKWGLILGVGTGISDDSVSRTNVTNNVSVSLNLEVDYHISVVGLYRISNNISLGPALFYSRATATFLGVSESRTEDEVGLALSFHSQNRKHAIEVFYGADSTTSLGYRWSR